MKSQPAGHSIKHDVYLVPTAEVADVWPHVQPLLAKALEYAPAQADYLDILLRGEQGLLVVTYDGVIKGAATLQFVRHPGELVLVIVLMAGISLATCTEYLHFVQKLARDNGATALEFLGREGFKRWAASLGARAIHTVYRIEV